MSKGRDFRGPKKRGFDDDGPSPYDSPRPSRTPRSSFGAGSGGPQDMAPPSGPSIDAVVKWFKGDKGFGFVELGDGTGDAFLHIGALQAAGYEIGSSRREIEGKCQQWHERRSSDARPRGRYGWSGGEGAAVISRVWRFAPPGSAAPPILRPRFRSRARSNGSMTTRASASSNRMMAARTFLSIFRSSVRRESRTLPKASL